MPNHHRIDAQHEKLTHTFDDAVGMAEYLGCDPAEARYSLGAIADLLQSATKPAPMPTGGPLAAFLPQRKG